jgi:hypothetical protein
MTTRKKRKRKRKRKKQKRKRTKLTKKRRCCREVIAHEKRKERESAVHYNIKERERDGEKLILVINLIFVKQTQQKLRSLTGGVHFIAIGIHSHQAYNGPRFERTDYSAKRA